MPIKYEYKVEKIHASSSIYSLEGYYIDDAMNGVMNEIETLLNQYAEDNWEFYRFEHLEIEMELTSLPNVSKKYPVYALIFRRDKG